MERELIIGLTSNFESFVHHADEGIEFWLARELQHLMGYGEWRNFSKVISKAKTACEISGESIINHFVDVNKTIEMPNNATKN